MSCFQWYCADIAWNVMHTICLVKSIRSFKISWFGTFDHLEGTVHHSLQRGTCILHRDTGVPPFRVKGIQEGCTCMNNTPYLLKKCWSNFNIRVIINVPCVGLMMLTKAEDTLIWKKCRHIASGIWIVSCSVFVKTSCKYCDN